MGAPKESFQLGASCPHKALCWIRRGCYQADHIKEISDNRPVDGVQLTAAVESYSCGNPRLESAKEGARNSHPGLFKK